MANQEERIRYVEPTDIGGEGCDYPSPLEDYCISVSLSVTMGDRMSCGQGEIDGRTTRLFYTTEGKTMSFMGAKDGYLTTRFTDVRAGSKSDGHEECLGIESINISYEMNSPCFMFSPQVDIRFVDVRGIAVMSEEESKAGGIGLGSLYRSLFRFPYPLFKLTVKGYYGMPVTYNLTINGRTNVELDSSTGNFVLSVSFRGYMEGVYNDVPMSYVVVAPYMSYVGKEYWEAQKANGRFRYRNGGAMLTYPEFMKKISEAAEKEASLGEVEERNDAAFNRQQSEGLAALIDTFPLKNWKEDTHSGIIYTVSMLNEYGVSKYDEEDTPTQLAEYREKILKYDEAYHDNLIRYFDFMKKYEIENTERIALARNGDGRFIPESAEGAVLLDSLWEVVGQEVRHIPRMAKHVVLHIVRRGENNEKALSEILRERKKEVDAEYNKIKNEYEVARHQRLCDILTFPPTVRNLFNMAFAHYETFMHTVYQALSEIKSKIDFKDDSRKLSTLGITNDSTDSGYEDVLPPFPIVTGNVTRDGDEMTEAVWMGDWDLEEVHLVNSLLDAAKLYTGLWAQATAKGEDTQVPAFSISKDVKLSAYLTLKNIYDRWLCNTPESRWRLDVDAKVDTYNEDNYHQSDFDNFCYLDTFYHDIGDRLLVNATMVGNLSSLCLPVGSISTGGYAGVNLTFFMFLAEVSRSCGGNLMAVPLIYGARNLSDIENMFRAYPYIHEVDKKGDTSSYVFLYTYRPSEYLDTGNDFKNDGFYIDGKRKDLLPSSLSDTAGLFIPAFGVSFGKRNQGIFKSVDLKSSESTITDAVISKTIAVTSKASESPRETELFGQDVYSIYASRQFRCKVTMMGNAQIAPLMYFQLNNTPFWNGTYMIINVSHSITQGNMETTFEGVRVNRNTIPMAEGFSVTLKDVAWKSGS